MTVLIGPRSRIPVEITSGDQKATFYFGPLSMLEKSEFEGAGEEKLSVSESLKLARRMLRKTLKGVSGIQNPDGSEWVLEMDESGYVSEKALEDLEYLPFLGELLICTAKSFSNTLIEGQPVTNPKTGLPMAGIMVKKRMNL